MNLISTHHVSWIFVWMWHRHLTLLWSVFKTFLFAQVDKCTSNANWSQYQEDHANRSFVWAETQVLHCTGTFGNAKSVRKNLHSLNNPLKFQTDTKNPSPNPTSAAYAYLMDDLQIFLSWVPLSNHENKLIFHIASAGLHSFTYICSTLIAWFLKEKGNVTCFHDFQEHEKFRTIKISTKLFQETIDLTLACILSIKSFSKLKIQFCQVYLITCDG